MQQRGQIILQVGQSGDPAVLLRFQTAVFGLGSVKGPYPTPGRKPRWTWGTNRFEHVQAVTAALWPFLSTPKRIQVRSCFTMRAATIAARPARHAYYSEPSYRRKVSEGQQRA